ARTPTSGRGRAGRRRGGGPAVGGPERIQGLLRERDLASPPSRQSPRRTMMRRATIAIAAAGVTLGVAATPAAAFTARVTNPYFPLLKGMTWEYHGVKDGRRMADLVRVTGRVRRIQGVPCAVVADWTWLDGKLAERTTDWYTQDRHGTVWYYGERTAVL